MIQLTNPNADIYVPDGAPISEALARTTHLCIGAHPDDVEFFAYHGIAECFRDPEKWFTGVVVTDGAGSPRSGLYAEVTDEQMREIRRKEQRKAAAIGEYSAQVQLAHPSGWVKDPKSRNVTDDLERILLAAAPRIVYLHNPADKHDTHVAVLLHSLEALKKLPPEKRPRRAYGCEGWRDLDWLPDEMKIPLECGRYPNLAAALAGVFDSQISGGKRYDLAVAGRRLANATFHQHHEVDRSSAITWAMDLTPLIQEGTLSVEDFISRFVDRLKQDIVQRIGSFQGD